MAFSFEPYLYKFAVDLIDPVPEIRAFCLVAGVSWPEPKRSSKDGDENDSAESESELEEEFKKKQKMKN